MPERITVNYTDSTSSDDTRDREKWRVDLANNTATHESGLVMEFEQRQFEQELDYIPPPPNAKSPENVPLVGVRTFDGWTGKPVNFEDWQKRQGLPIADLARSLPRLMRLAGDAFVLARQEHKGR